MSSAGKDSMHADLGLTLSGRQVRLRLAVPGGAARAQDLLPALRTLTDAAVDAAATSSVEQGRAISCRKGCGACCRQLVPITPAEAQRLDEVVKAMPASRRKQVRARFAEAVATLRSTGMLERLRTTHPHDEASRRKLGMDYFRQAVACPFLEHEACSIYHERPLACREYLVTSPVRHCSDPNAEDVACVPMPVRVSRAFGELQARRESTQPGWVPLVLALEWAGRHAQPSRAESGPALLEALFALLGAHKPDAGTDPGTQPD